MKTSLDITCSTKHITLVYHTVMKTIHRPKVETACKLFKMMYASCCENCETETNNSRTPFPSPWYNQQWKLRQLDQQNVFGGKNKRLHSMISFSFSLSLSLSLSLTHTHTCTHTHTDTHTHIHTHTDTHTHTHTHTHVHTHTCLLYTSDAADD